MMDNPTGAELVSRITTEMHNDSKYLYRDSLEYTPCKYSRSMGWGELEQRIQISDITTSDAFIAYAVYKLGFCNIEMIALYLRHLKKLWPDSIAPADIELRSLKNRIRILASSGVVRAFQYTIPDARAAVSEKTNTSTVIVVYSITELGAVMTQRLLCMSFRYDSLLPQAPLFDVFRRLACGYVSLCLLNNIYCEEYISGEILYLGKNLGDINVYSRLYFKDRTDGERYLVYVEPLFMSTDVKVLAASQNAQEIKRRAVLLERHANYVKDNYKDVKIVYVVENWERFIAGLKILKKYCSPSFIENNCWFTSENVLYQNRQNVTSSFIKVRLETNGDRISLKTGLAVHPVILSGKKQIMGERADSSGSIDIVCDDSADVQGIEQGA